MYPWDSNAPGWAQIPPGYSQPQPAHGGYWQQPAWTEPPKDGFFNTDRFTSKTRNPQSLHPILDAEKTMARVDIRFQPSSEAGMQNATYYAYRHAYATATQASRIRLISKDFPWSIDIKTNGHPVSCDNVWSALHAALQQPLVDSEWGTLSHDPSKAKKVQKAAKQRQSDGDKDKDLKRVDWVADSFIFRGLEKDDDFAKRRLTYADSGWEETWVVKLETR